MWDNRTGVQFPPPPNLKGLATCRKSFFHWHSRRFCSVFSLIAGVKRATACATVMKICATDRPHMEGHLRLTQRAIALTLWKMNRMAIQRNERRHFEIVLSVRKRTETPSPGPRPDITFSGRSRIIDSLPSEATENHMNSIATKVTRVDSTRNSLTRALPAGCRK